MLFDTFSSGKTLAECQQHRAAATTHSNACITLSGALVANLTLLAFQRKDPNFLEYVITNEEAKDKFSITDNGLLHTKVLPKKLCHSKKYKSGSDCTTLPQSFILHHLHVFLHKYVKQIAENKPGLDPLTFHEYNLQP